LAHSEIFFCTYIIIELLSNVGIGQDKSGEKLEAHEKFAEPREVEVSFTFPFRGNLLVVKF